MGNRQRPSDSAMTSRIRQPQHLKLPAATRKLAAKLFEQQMWCWGCDIRHPDNLLLQYGFQRLRPPEGIRSSSVYLFSPTSDSQVALWGFGLFYGKQQCGGLYLKRSGFDPRFTRTMQLAGNEWESEPETETALSEVQTHELWHLIEATQHWIADYEQWVESTYGIAYRQQCVDCWHRKVSVPAPEMSVTWRQLAFQ